MKMQFRVLSSLALALVAARSALSYPDVWQSYAGTTCAHPDGSREFSGHEGPIIDSTATLGLFTVSAEGGSPTTQLCPGKRYSIKVNLPILATQEPHLYLTASAGSFDKVLGDIVSTCSDGGTKRATAFAATSYTSILTLGCADAGPVRLFATYAVRGGVFHQASLNVSVDATCTAASCSNGGVPEGPSTSPKPSTSPSPAPSKPCSLPCSCAFGVAYEENLCGYANTTQDVRLLQAELAKPDANFAGALDIYNNARIAKRDDGTPRTMVSVTKRNYSQEAYYALSSSYFKKEFYLDDVFGAALRGDGDYAGACCGVRAEVAIAGARWFSGAYAMHEVNAGQCFATGCNDRPISLLLASEEILHGMALLTAADSAAPKPPKAPNGTANPATLFQTTNTIAKFYCTFSASKKEPLSPVNRATVTASTNASAAAAAGNLPGLATHYQAIEKAFVARFLQYSLRSAYDASKTASKGLLKKSGACRSPCLRLAQQAAARTYFRAAEPIIARTNPDLVARANAILTAPDPLKTYKDLVLAYQAIATALGQDTKKMLLKCKTK